MGPEAAVELRWDPKAKTNADGTRTRWRTPMGPEERLERAKLTQEKTLLPVAQPPRVKGQGF
jgi:hypothetical protein